MYYKQLFYILILCVWFSALYMLFCKCCCPEQNKMIIFHAKTNSAEKARCRSSLVLCFNLQSQNKDKEHSTQYFITNYTSQIHTVPPHCVHVNPKASANGFLHNDAVTKTQFL